MINTNFVASTTSSGINAVVGGVVGYLTTRTVTSLNPEIGLAFGALYGASYLISMNIPSILTDDGKYSRVFNKLTKIILTVVLKTVLVAVVLNQGFNKNLNNKTIITLGKIALLIPVVTYEPISLIYQSKKLSG